MRAGARLRRGGRCEAASAAGCAVLGPPSGSRESLPACVCGCPGRATESPALPCRAPVAVCCCIGYGCSALPSRGAIVPQLVSDKQHHFIPRSYTAGADIARNPTVGTRASAGPRTS